MQTSVRTLRANTPQNASIWLVITNVTVKKGGLEKTVISVSSSKISKIIKLLLFIADIT